MYLVKWFMFLTSALIYKDILLVIENKQQIKKATRYWTTTVKKFSIFGGTSFGKLSISNNL